MDFSIIIPAYNCEKYIREAIGSVLKQSTESKELIIINDGSTDKTKEICSAYEEQYEFIRLINKENTGVSDSRNTGIRNSSGEYVIFLDADDKLSEDALKKYKEIIVKREHPDIILSNLCYINGDVITKAAEMEECDFISDKNKFVNDILDFYRLRKNKYGNLRSVWAKAFSRKLIEFIEFNKSLKVGEDMLFFLQAALNSEKITVCNNYTYYYRKNEESVMHTLKWKGINSNASYYELVQEITESRNIQNNLFSLWLEINEREWINLIESNHSFFKKYRMFCAYRKIDTYKKYSNIKKNDLIGKEKLYLMSIRYRFILLWMFIAKLKSNKFRKKER